MRITVRLNVILVSIVIAVLMVGCSASSSDVDALVSTSVAGTIGAQSNSEQQPPVSDGPPQTSIYCPDCQLVEVTGVVDGDTIDTTIGRVRFFGIDTPERGEGCFEEATEFTRQLVGNQVRLEDGPRLEDTYGRRLAYVFDGSGNSIDVQLIAGGFATAWTRDGQHKDLLVGLEESAKSNRAGCLWATN
jgi:micrococcal nuclease